MYPEDEDHPYRLIRYKMSCLDISALPDKPSAETILAT
jgi:hypothetical protein